jgi:replicative DNA helicase
MSDLRECVTGETLVCLTDGRRVPIRELVGQAPRVWAMNEQQKIVAADSDLVWSVGTKPVFKVSLASGRSIRATANHRLFTDSGWRTVGSLAPGQRLAIASAVAATAGSAATRVGRSLAESARALVHAAAPHAALVPAGAHGHPMRDTDLRSNSSASPEDFATIRVGSHIDWDRLVSVEADGEEEVFDLTVPGPASWFADGIVSHNSGAIEQDADVILLIYREEVYEQNTTRKGIADIIIAKQRNGPTGEVHLTFLGEYTRFENLVAESYGEGVFR